MNPSCHHSTADAPSAIVDTTSESAFALVRDSLRGLDVRWVRGSDAAMPKQVPRIRLAWTIDFGAGIHVSDGGVLGDCTLELCAAYRGKPGVAEVVIECDGADDLIHRVVAQIPGSVARDPQGPSCLGFEAAWIPNGFERPLAALPRFGNRPTRIERAILEIGDAIGLSSYRDVYEVHLTVLTSGASDVSSLRTLCTANGVKLIHVELPEGAVPSQLITASIHRGSLEKVETEAAALRRLLSERGYGVTRTKVEAFLKNSCVPETPPERPDQYFEFHAKVVIASPEDLTRLKEFCATRHVHMSRTSSNRLASGEEMRFTTMRVYRTGRVDAERYFDAYLTELTQRGWAYNNVIREFTILDTKPSLDDGWADTPCAYCAATECIFGDSSGKIGPGWIDVLTHQHSEGHDD